MQYALYIECKEQHTEFLNIQLKLYIYIFIDFFFPLALDSYGLLSYFSV